MGFNANQNEIIIETLVLPFVATLAVLARLYARRKVSRTWTLDDYCTIAAGVFYWGYSAVVVDAALNGRTGVDPLSIPYHVLMVALQVSDRPFLRNDHTANSDGRKQWLLRS
jgi:hypothetical protein